MAENITSAKATAKMVRVAPRKARFVLDAIRGKSVAEAFAILKFTSRGAASDVEKVSKELIEILGCKKEDILKMVVVNRYHNAPIAKAFIKQSKFMKKEKEQGLPFPLPLAPFRLEPCAFSL